MPEAAMTCDACEGFGVVTWAATKGGIPVHVVAACTCTGLGWSAVISPPTPVKIDEAVARIRERVAGKVGE